MTMPHDGEVEITTHSMLKTFNRCPRMALYQYRDELRPRAVRRPLKMGKWFHSLLESHYKEEDWEKTHQKLIAQHEESFFDEEVGDIPEHCEQLMRSYLWHYQLEKRHGWKILDVECKLICRWPDGSEYWCRFDLLVEDSNGDLWIVDHKLRSVRPSFWLHLIDSQCLLYIWAAWKNKIPVKGFIWNYVRMKPPTSPRVLKNGELSKRKIETDYPTLRRTIRENGIDPRLYDVELSHLKSLYWRPEKEQNSPFFKRIAIEPDKDTVLRKVREMYKTRKRMANYNWDNRDGVERVTDRTCETNCSFILLCSTELIGGNVDLVLKHNFQHVDPLDYYAIQ